MNHMDGMTDSVQNLAAEVGVPIQVVDQIVSLLRRDCAMLNIDIDAPSAKEFGFFLAYQILLGLTLNNSDVGFAAAVALTEGTRRLMIEPSVSKEALSELTEMYKHGNA